MNSSIKGAVKANFGNSAISFSTGWDKNYFSNISSSFDATNNVKTEKFTIFDGMRQEIERRTVSPKSAAVLGTTGLGAYLLTNYGLELVTSFLIIYGGYKGVKAILENPEETAKTGFKTAIEGAQDALWKSLGSYLKDRFSLAGCLVDKTIGTLVVTPVVKAIEKMFNNVISGKDIFDGVDDKMHETFASKIPKAGVSIITLLGSWANLDDKQRHKGILKVESDPIKLLDKFLTKDATDRAKAALADMDGFTGKKEDLRRLEELLKKVRNNEAGKTALEKRGISSTKELKKKIKAEKREIRNITDRQEVWDKLGMKYFEKGKGPSMNDRFKCSGAFLKNYGASMAAGCALDTVVAVSGNILKNLANGESFGDAIKDCGAGEEFLKASVKGVCTTAGAIIGGAFGNAELGKKIGSVVGGIVGDLAVKPFTHLDEDGNVVVEQGWCAAAGAAVLGGGLLGGAIAAFAICGATPPIGWVVGAAMLVGAAIGYGIVCLVHSWDSITQAVGDFFESAATYVENAAKEIAAAVCDVASAAVAVVSDVATAVGGAVVSVACALFWWL